MGRRLPKNSGQQKKRQKVVRAYIVGPDNKNGYAVKLPLSNECKLHHTGPCTVKCNHCKRVSHMTRDCRTPIHATTQRPSMANQKTAEMKENLAGTLTSLQIMLMLKERPSRFAYIDWLSKYHVVMVCDEKIVCIPYGNEILMIQGDRSDAHITEKKVEKKPEEKRLEDVPIVRDFLEVFIPEYMPFDYYLNSTSKMDDPNITMEEYIRLEEEKAQRHGRTFNWQTATFEKIENYEDEDDCFIDFKTEFPAILFDKLTEIPSEPTVCPNEIKIDFRISLDESD
ncbi:hypothetical protein Tco_1457222 [Tanacetum coccineum]